MFVVYVMAMVFCMLGLLTSFTEAYIEINENFDRSMAYVRFTQGVMWAFCGIIILEIM